jgi:hypothetical protein
VKSKIANRSIAGAIHLFFLVSGSAWFIYSTISGYYYLGWLSLAILCGFFSSVYIVQPLFELIQIGLCQIEKRRSWKVSINKNSLFLLQFEMNNQPAADLFRFVRVISLLIVISPFLYITVSTKGPTFIFTLLTQIFWLCACSQDFRDQ